jgi:hypothetical protein
MARLALLLAILSSSGCAYTIFYRDGYTLPPTKNRPACDALVLKDDQVPPPHGSKKIGSVQVRNESGKCTREMLEQALVREVCAAGGNVALVTRELATLAKCPVLVADLWLAPADFLARARAAPTEESEPLGNIRIKSK